MSCNLQINVINSDNMTINQIKREKFRTTIRKQQLESLFQQNRQIHKLGNEQLNGNENIQNLLIEFFTTGENFDEMCNVIDSYDVFDAYNQISEFIEDIKLYLNQPLNHQKQFLSLFKILNNCILVKPTIVKQIIRDKQDKPDLGILYQIFNILESEEWKELHETCLQTLNYLIEQENKIIEIIEIEKQFLEQIINWGNNLGSIEYLQNLTEFLSLYLQQNRKIEIENQFKITQELIIRALDIKDIQIIYGILLLSFCLSEEEFRLCFGHIKNIFEFFIEQLKQNLSDFEYIVIFKGIKDCIKRMPDIFFYMMSQYYLIELLYEYSQKLKKQAGKDCLKLIACCYKTYINQILEIDLKDQILNQQIKKNLYEFSNKFIIIYLDSDFNLSYKIKILDKLFKFCKFVEQRQQQITQFDLNLYVKYFLIINNALRQDNLIVEQIFYILEALQNLIQIEDMEQQKEILKLIPNELMDILNELSLHENEQLADEIQNLIILFQFC